MPPGSLAPQLQVTVSSCQLLQGSPQLQRDLTEGCTLPEGRGVKGQPFLLTGDTLMGSICSRASLCWLMSGSFVLQFDFSLSPVMPSYHRGSSLINIFHSKLICQVG